MGGYQMKKIKIFNGTAYEEQGPYCCLCGAHYGDYYYSNGRFGWDTEASTDKPLMFLNPHDYDSYSTNTCPDCGAVYDYEEGNMLVLTDEDKQALLALRRKDNG
jgi:hypothetical protein